MTVAALVRITNSEWSDMNKLTATASLLVLAGVMSTATASPNRFA
jgi:hypothetical protein